MPPDSTRVELVFFDGCPLVDAMRGRLRAALEHVGLPPTWTEWNTDAVATPERVRGYASPAVLLNGVDIQGKEPTTGPGCAVGGGPDLDELIRALDGVRA